MFTQDMRSISHQRWDNGSKSGAKRANKKRNARCSTGVFTPERGWGQKIFSWGIFFLAEIIFVKGMRLKKFMFLAVKQRLVPGMHDLHK